MASFFAEDPGRAFGTAQLSTLLQAQAQINADVKPDASE